MTSREVSSKFRELKNASSLERIQDPNKGVRTKLVISNNVKQQQQQQQQQVRQQQMQQQMQHMVMPQIIHAEPERFAHIRRKREGAVTSRPEHLTARGGRDYAYSHIPISGTESVGGGGKAYSASIGSDNEAFGLVRKFSQDPGRTSPRSAVGGAQEEEDEDDDGFHHPMSPKSTKEDLGRSGDILEERELELKRKLTRENAKALRELMKRQTKREKDLDSLESEVETLAAKIAKDIDTLQLHITLAEREKLEKCDELCEAIRKHLQNLEPVRRELTHMIPQELNKHIPDVMNRLATKGKETESRLAKEIEKRLEDLKKRVIPSWITQLFDRFGSGNDDEDDDDDEDDHERVDMKRKLMAKASPQNGGSGKRKRGKRAKSKPRCLGRLIQLILFSIKLGILLSILAFIAVTFFVE